MIRADPEQEGLCLGAAFIAAHFKLHQGMGDFTREVMWCWL